MTQVGDVLELLHRAGRGFETVFAEYCMWLHHARSVEADTRSREAIAAALRLPRRAESVAAARVLGKPDPDATSERIIRLWTDSRGYAREEQEGWGGPSYSVFNGTDWWRYSESTGAMTNDPGRGNSQQVATTLRTVLDPFSSVSLVDLEVVGQSERVGRPVIETVGRPRPFDRRHTHPARMGLDDLGRGADELLLEVDAERGILLRTEARLRGEPFLVKEALKVVFDEPIAPERFVFEPPPGVPVETMSEAFRVQHNVGIGDAIDAVSFGLYVLDRVSPGWTLTITVRRGRERVGIRPHVVLDYQSADATQSLSVSQTAPPDGGDETLSPPPPWEEIERDGFSMRVIRRSKNWPQAQVRVVRDGTQITMSSLNMSPEALTEAATRLVPARRPD